MDATGLVSDVNWTSSSELASSLIEQLRKAYVELEAYTGAVEGRVQWNEVEKHFQNLQSIYKKKFEVLEYKEKDFADRELKAQKTLAEKEASVFAKEQDLLNWIQEMKDAAVASIRVVGRTHTSEAVEHLFVGDSKGNKVSSSHNENPPHGDPEKNSPINVPKKYDELPGEVNPQPELMQICKQMDAKRLLKIMENQQNLSALSKELPVALNSANEPARLVLDSLVGFFPSHGATQHGEPGALLGMRKCCLILMEAFATLLAKADTSADFLLNPETKQCAKAIANEWRPNLSAEGMDAANGKSLEAEGLLRLLATFRIASEFDEEELCKLVLAVADNRQAPELCQSLGLTPKIPDIVQTLINNGKQVEAVHFIQFYRLSERFSPITLLKTYLKDVRRNSQGKGGGVGSEDYNASELAALRAVIACVMEYNLENEYSLETLHKRVAQLEKSKNDKKRAGETGHKQQQLQQQKKPRANGAFHGNRTRGGIPAAGASRNRPRGGGSAARGHDRVIKSASSHLLTPGGYPHAGPCLYSYPNSAQPAYLHEASSQPSYYYTQDDRLSAPSYDAGAPTYGSFVGSGMPSHQPYM